MRTASGTVTAIKQLEQEGKKKRDRMRMRGVMNRKTKYGTRENKVSVKDDQTRKQNTR